ncbi:hydroxymethylpyrimidine/phosphomethylpyrimidine kinase [Enteractinococcus fodinae]
MVGMYSIHTPAVTLTIAGSEATGGAGAQADLRTFQELGTYGTAALTCIVSYNPADNWNHRLTRIDPEVLANQLEAIQANFAGQLDTVKLGMMGSVETIEVVAEALRSQDWKNVVLDPVLICKGQEPGEAQDTDEALKSKLLPLATVTTPNHFEAEQLSGMTISNLSDLKDAARKIHDDSGVSVLAKGGVRLEGPEAVDVFYDGSHLEVLGVAKIGNHAVSGAGCSLAAAVAAELAKGQTELEAAERAKDFVTAGISQRMSAETPYDVMWQGGLRKQA